MILELAISLSKWTGYKCSNAIRYRWELETHDILLISTDLQRLPLRSMQSVSLSIPLTRLVVNYGAASLLIAISALLPTNSLFRAINFNGNRRCFNICYLDDDYSSNTVPTGAKRYANKTQKNTRFIDIFISSLTMRAYLHNRSILQILFTIKDKDKSETTFDNFIAFQLKSRN